MRISKIILNNFLSHEKNEINFKGEINVIIGQNGAGKSSIIDGIVFGLFREHSRGTIDNLIRKGTNRASIKLHLLNERDEIIIDRNISKGNSSIEDGLIKNGKPLAYSAKKVSEELEKILGIDKDIALSTIIVKQGELDKILDDFQEVIGKILKLESIEKLTDTRGPIVSFRKDLENKLKLLDTIKEQYESDKKRLEEKQRRIKELEEKREKLNKELDTLETNLDELRDQFEKYDAKRNKYIELRTSLEEKRNTLNSVIKEINRLKKETENLENIENEVKELDKLKEIKAKLDNYEALLENNRHIISNIKDLSEEIQEFEKAIARKKELENKYLRYKNLEEEKKKVDADYRNYIRLKSELESKIRLLEKLEKQINEITRGIDKINELENKIKELREKQSHLQQQLGEVNNSLNEKEELVRNISQIKGNTCPVCGRSLDEYHKVKIVEETKAIILELRKKKSDLNKKLNETIEELNKAESEYKILSNNKAKYDDMKRQMDEFEKEIESLRLKIATYTNIEEKMKSITEELEILKSDYEEYIRLSKYDESKLADKKQRLESLLNEKNKLEEKLRSLENEIRGFDKKSLQEKISNLEKKKDILEDMKKKRSALETYLQQRASLEDEIRKLESELANIQFSENEYNELKSRIDNLEKEINERRNDISRIEGELHSEKRDIESLVNQIENYERQLMNKDKIEQAINKLEKIRTALGEKRLQSYIVMTTKQVIENNLNDIISKFDLSIKNVEIEITPKIGKGSRGTGNIIVYTNNGDTLPIVALSGGEKIALAIALRLAIAKTLMTNTNFFILDEPTIHLDDQRKTYLIELIRAAKESVPQIIVVTHDEEVLQAGDYVIRVEKRGNKSIVREET
ncbi:SMC family ATPase [Sulfolobus tengchongensis]|uniref:DNA double-strand break repair Rad50 ATPase n=1 Tax=Sulfolobus tengchongensis TaxID=207809 RepID=A0AAX4L3C8_9CREN